MKAVAEFHEQESPGVIHVNTPTMFGRRLEPGDVLERGDVYASAYGTWEPCPYPGLMLQEGITTVWVRPGSELVPETEPET